MSAHVVSKVGIVVHVLLLLWLTILLLVATMLLPLVTLHTLLHVRIHLVPSVHWMVISHHLLREEIATNVKNMHLETSEITVQSHG